MRKNRDPDPAAGWSLRVTAFLGLLFGLGLVLAEPLPAQRVELTIGPGLADGPVTGRMFVIFSRDDRTEPRLQAGGYNGSVPFFGLDVSELAAGSTTVLDPSALGFPLKSLTELPRGEYLAQGLFVVYTKVTPKHGKTIWLPWDQWEGRRWNRTPGNLVTEVQRVSWDPGGS